MEALVFQEPGKKALSRRPIPNLERAPDAIVTITKTTISDTTLVLLKILETKKFNSKLLISHYFKFENIIKSNDMFRRHFQTLLKYYLKNE